MRDAEKDLAMCEKIVYRQDRYGNRVFDLERIEQMQKKLPYWINRAQEAEAQVEAMKCCGNCQPAIDARKDIRWCHSCLSHNLQHWQPKEAGK